jgi:hypothetical protein
VVRRGIRKNNRMVNLMELHYMHYGNITVRPLYACKLHANKKKDNMNMQLPPENRLELYATFNSHTSPVSPVKSEGKDTCPVPPLRGPPPSFVCVLIASSHLMF